MSMLEQIWYCWNSGRGRKGKCGKIPHIWDKEIPRAGAGSSVGLWLPLCKSHCWCWQCRNCSPGSEGVSGDASPEPSSSERSLGLQESTAEDREMLNSEKGTSPNNFCAQNKSMQSLGVTESPETAVTKLTFGRKSFSPVLTEASLVRALTFFWELFYLKLFNLAANYFLLLLSIMFGGFCSRAAQLNHI